eukprot:8080276-Pyramimonas_sp.AAC.1
MAVFRQGIYVEYSVEYSKGRALNGILVSTVDDFQLSDGWNLFAEPAEGGSLPGPKGGTWLGKERNLFAELAEPSAELDRAVDPPRRHRPHRAAEDSKSKGKKS